MFYQFSITVWITVFVFVVFPCVSWRHSHTCTYLYQEKRNSSPTKYSNRMEWGGKEERRCHRYLSNEQSNGSGIKVIPHRAPTAGLGHPLVRLTCLLAGCPNCREQRETVVCIPAQKCQGNLCPPYALGGHTGEVAGYWIDPGVVHKSCVSNVATAAVLVKREKDTVNSF